MAHRYCFSKAVSSAGQLFLIAILISGLCAVLSSSVSADPPVSEFYYPPGNVPPGPPPNYNQVDSAYFAGEPALPLPPPDSGGVYIWVNSDGIWNVANHIYSLGFSLEQFHGSILARMETPPAPGVNIFATNFELFGDTTKNKCYLQNDRWGWYDWGNGLYEIWWDVCTREWRSYGGDPNDLMIMMVDGCAIDFNIWSSGHSSGGKLTLFGPDQIYLGESKTRLSDVPEFADTYPGISDPYQQQAGNDPTVDPNITIFSRREGNGSTYNMDGLIIPGQTYPCGPILNQSYGDRFSGPFVYEGDGVEFSSVCAGMQGPGLEVDGVEIPPINDNNSDVLIDICGGTQIWSLINEFSPWENANRFGYYPDLGTGANRILEFVGSDGMGHVDTTAIPSNTTAGLWLHTDANGNLVFDGSEVLLFSQRALTMNSADNSNQWFMVYDVSAYRGTGAVYNFFCPTEDYSFTGDFDYLIFIDDGNIPANYDYNDMMVGMLCYNAPEIVCPPDIAIECGGSTDPAVTGYATAIVSCGSVAAIGYSDAQNGNIITRTWTATDDCGASASCIQIITIVDSTPPSIICPEGIAIQCLSEIPAPDINSVTATDICDPNPVVTFVRDISDGNSCPEIITRTYRATDASGNAAECSQGITIDDNTAPIINCPANITVDCGASTDPSNTGFASATDNCTTIPNITYSDNRVNNVITRTWTASDDCGNSSQCFQTLTLLDTTPPTITCPTAISVQCITGVPTPDINLVSASDDCDDNPAITFRGDQSDGNSCPEIITRTYRATDLSGNYSECTQLITIMDNTPPSIICPANLTIACSDPTDPDFTGSATATDNCDSAPAITYTDVVTDQLILRTWVAADDCGNSNQCLQTIAIAENLPPVVECPTEVLVVITLDLTEICFIDIPYYDPDNEIASVEVNGVVMSGDDICFVPQNWGPNNVTVICTDICGASTECSFTVIVGACVFLPGDANVDGLVNLIDVVDMLDHLLDVSELPDDGQCDCRPNVPFVPFYGGADVNGNCMFNVADVVYLMEFLEGTDHEPQYCPLCPPTEGWLPPLIGGIGKIRFVPLSTGKTAFEGLE